MNASRDELIQLAAETLDCEGHGAHGHYVYHDKPTGWWMVSDADMAALGRLAYEDPANAYSRWCDATTAMEVDMDLIVRDYEITAETDMDTLAAECLAMEPADIMTALVLTVARAWVLETVRINSEIDRDHETDSDDQRNTWDPLDAFDDPTPGSRGGVR
jgi:hypothetical protein